MRTEAEATIAAPVTPDNMGPQDDPDPDHNRESHQQKNSLEQDPTALMSCFPSSFLPFLRSNRRDIALKSLLAYWNDPENVKYSRNAATLKFSFGIALDRALQGDWEMAPAFLLNGAFLEQSQRCGGLDNIYKACLNSSDERDRGKLFGLYFGALRASQSKNTTLRFLEKKVDKKQLAIIQMRSDMRKRNVSPSKRKPVENEPGSNTCPSSPVSMVICYQEASNYVEDEHELIVSPNQEIRLVFAKYAKTIRKVPLRSLRFNFPIHLPELEGMDKTAAEHLTIKGLGLNDRRIKVFCTAAHSVEPPSDTPAEMKTPMAASTPANTDIPEISPLSTLLTPERPAPTFVDTNKRVKYSHPLITAVNSQQVMTLPPPKQGAIISPGTPHTQTGNDWDQSDISPACVQGLVETSPFPSHLGVGFPNILRAESFDSAHEEASGKPQIIHRPRSNLDSLCMLSHVATSLATNNVASLHPDLR